MRYLIFFVVFILLSSCGQNYNSNFNDSATYGNSGITPGTNLYYAYNVLQSKCFSCHGDAWKNYTASSDWINSGLIVSGSLTNSSIYNSLKNNGGSMPKDPISALTSAEINAIENWINVP